MNIKPSGKVGGLLLYIDKDGLSPKAKNIRTLNQLSEDINSKAGKILESFDLILMTVPSVIVSTKFYPYIDQIIKDSIVRWKKMIRLECLNLKNDVVLFQTTLSLSNDVSNVIDEIKRFLEIHKPEQLLITPVYDFKNGIKITSKSIPGNILIEIMGVTEYLDVYKKALKIITPVADSIFIKNNKKMKILPEYQFIGIHQNGTHFLNMLDYKI